MPVRRCKGVGELHAIGFADQRRERQLQRSGLRMRRERERLGEVDHELKRGRHRWNLAVRNCHGDRVITGGHTGPDNPYGVGVELESGRQAAGLETERLRRQVRIGDAEQDFPKHAGGELKIRLR